jgi:hypothetical protein
MGPRARRISFEHTVSLPRTGRDLMIYVLPVTIPKTCLDILKTRTLLQSSLRQNRLNHFSIVLESVHLPSNFAASDMSVLKSASSCIPYHLFCEAATKSYGRTPCS